MDWVQQAPYRLSGYLAWGLCTLPLYRFSGWMQSRLSLWPLLLLTLLAALFVGITHRVVSTLIEIGVKTLFFEHSQALFEVFLQPISCVTGRHI